MRLNHYEFESPIEFDENTINVVVVENQSFLTKIIYQLIEQIDGKEGDFNLYCEKEMKIKDSVFFILDPFRINMNERAILARLYEDLQKDAMGEDIYQKTNDIQNAISEYIHILANRQQHQLTNNEMPSVVDIIKIMNVRFDESTDSLLDVIVDYISLLFNYCKIKLVIFLNLKSYLTNSELELLYKHVHYHKHFILLIESTERTSLPCESVKMIDLDLCEVDISKR